MMLSSSRRCSAIQSNKPHHASYRLLLLITFSSFRACASTAPLQISHPHHNPNAITTCNQQHFRRLPVHEPHRLRPHLQQRPLRCQSQQSQLPQRPLSSPNTRAPRTSGVWSARRRGLYQSPPHTVLELRWSMCY